MDMNNTSTFSNLKNPMDYVNGKCEIPGANLQNPAPAQVQTPVSDTNNAVGVSASNNFDNTVNSNLLNMDNIMDASFGEVANEMTVNFKKTVLIRDYETEVIESTTTLKLDKTLTGIERMFVQALLEVQMEYTVYVNLLCKGTITNSAFNQRKQFLETAVNSIKVKMDKLLGEEAAKNLISYTKLT